MEVEFRSPLVLEVLTDDWWRLWEPFEVVVWESNKLASQRIVVPHGFITDLASVPRVALLFLKFGKRGNKAAALHDYLYSAPAQYPREWCDAAFYYALLAQGMPEEDARVMYDGVVSFGEAHFNKPIKAIQT